jgi:hypothetical protein
MTIEVRQMLIRSVITEPRDGDVLDRRQSPAELEQLRAQLLKDCKTWLAEALRKQNER